MAPNGGKVVLLPAAAPCQQNTTYRIMFHDMAWQCFAGGPCCWQKRCFPSPAGGPPASRKEELEKVLRACLAAKEAGVAKEEENAIVDREEWSLHRDFV
ncbi:hypothetical protein NDU88_011213 [Pleurodeles waltl]|uniref:Uncharacterized protein n=1 Tax=Pleurodeles waltl TaxID=8319 RepID=A0AAV7R0Z4_PLEWA|nr:hypothetical protein NDU88_011213 [Pleurodeles waltl]